MEYHPSYEWDLLRGVILQKRSVFFQVFSSQGYVIFSGRFNPFSPCPKFDAWLLGGKLF
jgi:hypothetical protein